MKIALKLNPIKKLIVKLVILEYILFKLSYVDYQESRNDPSWLPEVIFNSF